jgi:hypothetical protein
MRILSVSFPRTVTLTMLLCSMTALGALSTRLGSGDWSEYGVVNSAPPINLFIGAWTHVTRPMGSGSKGNDYPFVVSTSESPYIYCVSGNMGWDGGANSWVYNANTMTGSGDHVTVYLHTTETEARDWVYVAWHFQRSGSRTKTTQYVKFGPNGPTQQVAQETVTELYTWTKLYMGGCPNDGGYSSYMQYARAYDMSSPPDTATVTAIAMRTTHDPTAWGEWPLIDAGTSDVSGHGRNISISGSWISGIEGPALGGSTGAFHIVNAQPEPFSLHVQSPFGGMIRISSGQQRITGIRICNLRGDIVLTGGPQSNGTGSIDLPATGLARGSYVLKCHMESVVSVNRIIAKQ